MARVVTSAVTLILLASWALSAETMPAPQVPVLEKKLFHPSLSSDELAALLKDLRDEASREAAVTKLIAGAAGLQERIAAAIANETDVNVTAAAAAVVEALDDAAVATAYGKQLRALYAAQGDKLLPDAWKDFRKDPLDGRAAAILTSIDPDTVAAWIAKNGDYRDGLRFVLLRIRELHRDDWAARQVAKFSYESFLKTAGDVFPAGSAASNTAGARLVGHTLLRHVWGVRQSQADGLPKIEQVCMARRMVYIFRLRSGLLPDGYAALKFDVKSWSSNGLRDVRPMWTGTYREYASGAPKGLPALPRLLFDNSHESSWVQHSKGMPAWAKAYAPKVYLDRLDFAGSDGKPAPQLLESTTQRAASEFATSTPSSKPVAVQAPADAPTIVVLPPRLPTVAPADTQTAALHACDMLEEGLARCGKVRVVSRANLGKLLEERKIAARADRPALSYDAMLRLSVDVDAFLPRAVLVLVDLSTGNSLASWPLDWPVNEDAITKLIEQMPARLAALSPPGVSRLTLRLAGVEPTQKRMGPLGLRLQQLFGDALTNCRKIMLVQHLEADSAMEESLLLMMGFSRLAGERQFAPHADATLELRISESDEIGKAFDDVPIEVSFRLRHGSKPVKDWTSFKGTVRDYDTLAAEAWQALTVQMDEADADVGSKMLDELSLRRRQALIELKAVDNVQPELPHAQLVRAKLDHLEAALKLDPLCEQAAFMRVQCLWEFYGHDFTKYTGSREVHELLLAAARYNDLFPQNADRNAQVQDFAWDAVRMTPLIKVFGGDEIDITPDLSVLLDAMKHMLELSVRGDPRRLSRGCPRFMPIVYRGMRQADVSLAQREAWMDGILASVRGQLTQLDKVASISRSNTVFHHHWIHLIAAQMAAEDDSPKRCQELLSFVRKQLDEPQAKLGELSQRDDLLRIMRDVLIKLDDAAALAEHDTWVKSRQTAIRPIWFGNLPGAQYSVYDLNDHPYKPIEIVYAPTNNWPRPLSPLCEGGGYLYALTWKDGNAISWSHIRGTSGQGVSQEIVRIPLDETGRPKGNEVLQTRPDQPDRNVGWDALEKLPQPTVNKHLQVLSARFIDGKLYLGTMYSGLLIFDVDKKQWNVIDPSAGLPCWGVYSIHTQDDGVLFCTGRDMVDGDYVCFYFTYALKSGEIRVLSKTDRKAGTYPHNLLLDVWKQNGLMRGLSENAVVPDVLAADYRKDIPMRGSGEYYSARLGERLFVNSDSDAGVSQLGPDGKFKGRIPMGGGSWTLPGFLGHWLLTRQDMPSDTPASGHLLGNGRYLWFHGSYVLYDPESKTWYGPLMTSGAASSGYCLAASGGLWVGTDRFLWFIDRQKYMDMAIEAGRAVKTQEYAERRDAAIAQMPPLPQARMLMMQKKFSQARDVLAPYLDAHKDEPLAILLQGMIHDSWGLKDLALAEDCYERLEAMPDPSVKFTGLYMQVHLLMSLKKWEAAAAAIGRIRTSTPMLLEEFESEIAALFKQVEKAMAAPRGTATSEASQRSG